MVFKIERTDSSGSSRGRAEGFLLPLLGGVLGRTSGPGGQVQPQWQGTKKTIDLHHLDFFLGSLSTALVGHSQGTQREIRTEMRAAMAGQWVSAEAESARRRPNFKSLFEL